MKKLLLSSVLVWASLGCLPKDKKCNVVKDTKPAAALTTGLNVANAFLYQTITLPFLQSDVNRFLYERVTVPTIAYLKHAEISVGIRIWGVSFFVAVKPKDKK